VALLAALVPASPAAANLLGPEPSNSPGADETSTLYWIALVVSVVIAVAVNGALIVAALRYRARRGREPRRLAGGRGVQIRAAGAIGALIGAFFVLSVIYSERARETPSTGDAGLASDSGEAESLTIEATGQQWLWRYQYPNGAFSYYRLVVPVDTAVRLDLDSTDVTHGWHVPSLAGEAEAVPGRTNHTWFKATDEGDYRGVSSTFSGAGYGAMRTEVSVVSREDYEAFVSGLKRDIEEAQRIAAEELLAREEASE
jgi:heme/copper-type cytochrome/quinol oxidase subunit 2